MKTFEGRLCHPPTPSLTLSTNASNTGWGAHLVSGNKLGAAIHRQFSPQEQRLYPWSSKREALAIVRALQHFGLQLKNKALQVQVNNTTVYCYLKKGAGGKKTIFQLLKESLCHAPNRGTTLVPLWKPREENELADLLSRVEDKTDWRLKKRKKWGPSWNALWTSRRQPVCQPQQSLVSQVVWMDTRPRSQQNQRPKSGLDSRQPLCRPSVPTPQHGADQSRRRTPLHNPRHSGAETSLVRQAPKTGFFVRGPGTRERSLHCPSPGSREDTRNKPQLDL